MTLETIKKKQTQLQTQFRHFIEHLPSMNQSTQSTQKHEKIKLWPIKEVQSQIIFTSQFVLIYCPYYLKKKWFFIAKRYDFLWSKRKRNRWIENVKGRILTDCARKTNDGGGCWLWHSGNFWDCARKTKMAEMVKREEGGRIWGRRPEVERDFFMARRIFECFLVFSRMPRKMKTTYFGGFRFTPS